MIKKYRDLTLDLTRTIAIILIVFTHVVEASIDPKIFLTSKTSLTKIVSFLCFTISRLGVPLFLFISGELILKKNFDDDKGVFRFYTHNLLRIVVDAWCWIIVYHLFLNLCLEENMSFAYLVKSIFFIEEQPFMVHMWYIPMIVGSYLIMPFLAVIVKKFSAKTLIIPFLISLVSYLVVPKIIGQNTKLYDNWIFGGYVFYFILGFWASQNKFNFIPTIFCALISFILLVLAVIDQILISNNCVWYDNPCIIFSAFFLFLVLKRTKIKKKGLFSTIIKTTSKISFQIYFIHMIPILLLNIFTSKNIKNLYLECLILEFAVFLISWLISYLLIKIKVFVVNKWKKHKSNAM